MMKYLPLILSFLIFTGLSSGAQEEPAHPDFEGIWDTTQGTMALWQVEDAVWGIYEGGGEIGGHVDENGRFEFTWDEGYSGRGNGWFELSDYGDMFSGYFYTDMDIDEHDRWGGEFIGPNRYEIADEAALEYDPDASIEPVTTPVTIDEPVTETEDEEEVTESDTDSEEDEEEISTSDFSPIAWTGTWDTRRGFLVLSAGDSSIFGSYDETGVIEGTMDGDSLMGTWTETDDDGNEFSGEFIFWINEDEMSFRGMFTMPEDPDLWLVWSGEKIIH